MHAISRHDRVNRAFRAHSVRRDLYNPIFRHHRNNEAFHRVFRTNIARDVFKRRRAHAHQHHQLHRGRGYGKHHGRSVRSHCDERENRNHSTALYETIRTRTRAGNCAHRFNHRASLRHRTRWREVHRHAHAFARPPPSVDATTRARQRTNFRQSLCTHAST